MRFLDNPPRFLFFTGKGGVGKSTVSVTLAVALASEADATAALATLETDELVLVHRAPLQSYLAPQVARCFHNSLEFQQRVFGWEPTEPVTVVGWAQIRSAGRAT